MKQIINIIFYIAAAAFVAGCSKDEVNNISENDILIEVEAPQTDGWSTENIAGTRSDETNIEKLEGEDGLDMTVNTQRDYTETPTDKATTRWANMNNNTTFRVVAYKCSAAASILTTNYVGYGDYTLASDTTVKTTKSLALPEGTYTFICYSYGSSTAIEAFSNSSTSVSVANERNFMTCVLPNITINNIGSKYTLNNIVFKHRCARYRIQAIAQSGRMGNITACSATLTLPSNSATYSFTNNSFVTNATSTSLNMTWESPSEMNVYSNYIYTLPNTSKTIEIELTLTVGGKEYSNKSVTLSGVTFNPNGIYHSDVSFTTTEGYIIGGNMWANGNLINAGETYTISASTMYCSKADNASDYFIYNNPRSNDPELITAWSASRDPCRKVLPVNTWKTPTVSDCSKLLSTGSVIGSDRTTYGEVLILPFTSFMRVITGHPHEPYFDFIGYYLTTSYPQCLQNGVIGLYTLEETLGFPIRCVRN